MKTLIIDNLELILLVISAITVLCWPSSPTDKSVISSNNNYAETAELERMIKEEKDNLNNK